MTYSILLIELLIKHLQIKKGVWIHTELGLSCSGDNETEMIGDALATETPGLPVWPLKVLSSIQKGPLVTIKQPAPIAALASRYFRAEGAALHC